MKRKQVLIAARKMIKDPKSWWNGRGKQGDRMCIYTAIYHANKGAPCDAAERPLVKITGFERLNEWNDAKGRTHGEVIGLFDKAIKSISRR